MRAFSLPPVGDEPGRILCSIPNRGGSDVWLGGATEPKKWRKIASVDGFKAVSVAWDTDLVASVGSDELVLSKLKTPGAGQRTSILNGYRDIALARDGRHFALAGQGGLELLEASDAKVVWNVVTDKPATVTAIAPELSIVAVGLSNGRVELRDRKTGEIRGTINAHPGEVSRLVFHPTQPLLASAGPDHAIRLWNVETREEVARFGSGGRPSAITFFASGDRLAVATAEFGGGVVRTWLIPK